MSNSEGSFIWYELMTADASAAGRFYAAVMGWKIAEPADRDAAGVDYRMIERGDGGNAGGMLQLTADMRQHGARSTWLGYLQVKNVDTASKAIAADGGKIAMPKRTLPVGEIAMLTDPMGAPFYVMMPVPPPGKPDTVSDVFDPKSTQRVRWNELTTPDLARAKAFYAKHFAFEFNETMSMGELGDYCFIDHAGVRLGAMLQNPAAEPIAGWLLYFGVPSIVAGKRAIEANGGKILNGPHELPGDDWFIVAADPQGAPFGLVGPKGG